MPSKINPNDWDTFFSATGPRRGGPISIFVRTALVLGVAGGLGYGLYVFNNQLATQTEQRDATTLAGAPTRTAQAFANAIQQTAQSQPTPTANLPIGRVLAQTPLRAEPNEQAQAQGTINPNDRVQFIKSQDVGGQTWWNIRLAERASTTIEGAVQGTTGWVPASVLTAPAAPPVVAAGTAVPAVLPPVSLNGATINLYRDPQTSISVSRDGRWNPQALPTLPLGVFLAPNLDSGEGVVAAKVLEQTQDAAGFGAALTQVAQTLAKPGSQPAISIVGTSAQNLDGSVTFVRVVAGQDITVRGRFVAKPAPGNSVGVVIAFVPDNSYAANEIVLSQITGGAIFQ